MNTYKGKRKRTFCVKSDKRGVTTVVYLSEKTVVSTVDSDGNIVTFEEPP